jgi:hypothetical protein
MILYAFRNYRDLIHKLYPELEGQNRIMQLSDLRPVQSLILDPDDTAVQLAIPNLAVEGSFNTWSCRVDCVGFDDEAALVLANILTDALRFDTRDPDTSNRPTTEYRRFSGYSVITVRFQFKLKPLASS